MQLKFDTTNLLEGLVGLENKKDRAVRIYAETSSKLLEKEAKVEAKWTDRTGAARRRLNGSVLKYEKGYRLKLSHGVDYGIWLELANEKRFAIIQPTILRVGKQKIIPGLKNLMDKMK